MAKKARTDSPQEESNMRERSLRVGFLLAILLTFSMICTGVVQASANAGDYHVTTTCNESADAAPNWQMAEMVCCHCYSTKSDGTRFYHGVLEAGFCRSQRGYCEGFAKCFP